jgi:GNAT superfamily N-acetyltransferase
MPFRIRPLDPNADLPRLADLTTAARREPVTADILAERERQAAPGIVQQRLVAVDADGWIAGFGKADREPWDSPGHFLLQLLVDPAARGQGIGAALYEALGPFLREYGAGRLEARARDDEPDSLRFAEARGFRIHRRLFKSTLDLERFDPAPFVGHVERLQAQGLRFFSFAETDGSEEARRRLYEVRMATARDDPAQEWDEEWPYEQFVRDVFEASGFRPEGQIFAADVDRWIGIAAVVHAEPGMMFNAFTGVRREYRGRGIALALKLLAIDFARRAGVAGIRTNNDSENAPILAINRRLGYVPEPGWYVLRKMLG